MKNEFQILIIEPDEDIRYVIRRAMPQTGFHFIEYDSIKETTYVADSSKIDLLICDKLSFYESDPVLFNQILNASKLGSILIQPEFSKIPSRIVSEIGFSATLLKPFTAQHLRQTIENVINQAQESKFSNNRKQKWLRLAFDITEGSLPKVTTLPQGKLLTTLAPDEIFDLIFDEIARRQPLPEDIDAFDVVEMQLIRRALEICKGNQSKASKFLGITRNTLRKRIKKYGFATLDNDDTEDDV